MTTTMATAGAPDGEEVVEERVTDTSRFEAFYMEVFRLARTLANRTVDAPTAEDIAQAIGVREWMRFDANRAAYLYPGDVRSFVEQATKHAITSHFRGMRRRGKRDFRYEAVRQRAQREWMDPEQALHTKAIEEDVVKDLAAQPPRSRETYLYVVEDGLPYKAVAERLQITEKTARNHLSRSMKSIRKATLKYWKDDQ